MTALAFLFTGTQSLSSQRPSPCSKRLLRLCTACLLSSWWERGWGRENKSLPNFKALPKSYPRLFCLWARAIVHFPADVVENFSPYFTEGKIRDLLSREEEEQRPGSQQFLEQLLLRLF